jgi:hypothetical protein
VIQTGHPADIKPDKDDPQQLSLSFSSPSPPQSGIIATMERLRLITFNAGMVALSLALLGCEAWWVLHGW